MALMVLITFSLALAGCGGGGSGGGSTPPPATYNITGAVTGPYVEGVTIAITGGATAVTDVSGNYSLASLPAGSYTLTPSLPGYTYTPPSASVVITNANGAQNFAAASTIASYSISGTVSYPGAKTGKININVVPASCGGTGPCAPVAGTSVDSLGAFTVRGFPPGDYIVRGRMDYLDIQFSPSNSPYGFSSPVTVVAANVTGADVVLADPAGPFNKTIPAGLKVSPANGSALIQWNPVVNGNGRERVTAYKISWGTDVNATTGTPIIVGVRGEDGLYIQSGLTDGTDYYYKIASCVDDLVCTLGSGTSSAAVGPVTIGATTGANTVSGTVTFPGTATGSLVVAVHNDSTGSVQYARIANPVSPQAYSIAGVPNGSLKAYVTLDMDNSGVASIGDLTYETYLPFTVSGNTTQNFTLSSASASARVSTGNSSNGTSSYSLQLGSVNGTKHLVRVTLVSGLNVAVPFDIGKSDGEFPLFVNLNTTRPTAGDAYVFKATFSDGTTETLTGSVTAVLDAFATNMGVQTTAPGTTTKPLFTWDAPVVLPATSFTYNVIVNGLDGGWYPEGGSGLPSTTFSTLYNADSKASTPGGLLTSGQTYNWYVHVEDANLNSATIEATPYLVP